MKSYYRCPECKQTSTRRWNILKHIQRIHPKLKKKPIREYTVPAMGSNMKMYCPWCGGRL